MSERKLYPLKIREKISRVSNELDAVLLLRFFLLKTTSLKGKI